MTMSVDSTWTRYPKTRTAVRGENGERITLMRQRGGWHAMVGTQSHLIDTSAEVGLDDVIVLVDTLFPPNGWASEASEDGPTKTRWVRPYWSVREQPDGTWRVFRTRSGQDGAGREDLATSKPFRSADRARHWVEIRLDRTGTNLRGPRPRAEQRAVKTLPDVRVTEAERAAAVALASRLGVSFSDLARAALKFVEEEATDTGRVVLARTQPTGELRIAFRT